MLQTLARALVHRIFSTKHRKPLVWDEFRPRLYVYIGCVLDKLKSPSLRTGGVPDPVERRP